MFRAFRLLLIILLALSSTPVRAAEEMNILAESAEVRRELTRGDEPDSTPKYVFQYATPEEHPSSRRFLVFIRQESENGVPGDSEILVISVRRKGAAILAERIFRDVSVLGLRSSRRAALSERELRAVFRAQGIHDQRRMGGRAKYLAFARSRLAEGDLSRDERWIFDQVLGKGWESAR